MLKWRIGLGAVMIAALVGLFVLDGCLRRDPPGGTLGHLVHSGLIVAGVCAVLCGIGAVELGRLARAGGYRPATAVMVFASVVLVTYPVLEPYLGYYWPGRDKIIGLLLLAALAAQFRRKRTEKALQDMAVTVFGILYLGFLGSVLVEIRTSFGVLPLAMLLVVVKGGDIGAYFTGLAFGKHKLVPWLSPGKTVEGLIGALVVATGLTLGFNYATDMMSADTYQVIIIGVVLALAGHFGDLVESLIKRDCAAKDSAKLLPAFGGVLDLVDSVLPAGLIWYIILSNIRSLQIWI